MSALAATVVIAYAACTARMCVEMWRSCTCRHCRSALGAVTCAVMAAVWGPLAVFVVMRSLVSKVRR